MFDLFLLVLIRSHEVKSEQTEAEKSHANELEGWVMIEPDLPVWPVNPAEVPLQACEVWRTHKKTDTGAEEERKKNKTIHEGAVPGFGLDINVSTSFPVLPALKIV